MTTLTDEEFDLLVKIFDSLVLSGGMYCRIYGPGGVGGYGDALYIPEGGNYPVPVNEQEQKVYAQLCEKFKKQ